MEFDSAFALITEGCTFKGKHKSKKPSVNSSEPKKKKQKLNINLELLSGNQKLEEVRHVRNVYHIKAYGTDLPDPVTSFDQLISKYGVSETIIKNLADMEISEPTPIQMQAIPTMLERRELLACAPTGSGKTAAFFLPLVHQLRGPQGGGVRALILAPTMELSQQTEREGQRLAKGTGVSVHFLDAKESQRAPEAGDWRGRTDVLVTTPNRLVWMLRQKPAYIELNKVEWLVVDECDKLFEGGVRGFREQLSVIYRACDQVNNPDCRRALFSATSQRDFESWAKDTLESLVFLRVGQKNAAVETVEQELIYCGTELGKRHEIRMMAKKGLASPCLIFLESKARAKELFKELVFGEVMVGVISAERTQEQRAATINAFRAGKLSVLICTDLMARGIDFKGVSLVINYDLPPSTLEYIHRIGRTGRAGQRGRALTFWTDDDSPNLRGVLGVMRNSGAPVNSELYRLILKSKKRTGKKQRPKNPKRAPISNPLKTKADIAQEREKRKRPNKKMRKKKRNNVSSEAGTSESRVKPSASKVKKSVVTE